MHFLLPRTITAAGQKEYESSLPVCYLTFPLILVHLVYHLLFLLFLRGTASLRLELSFTIGSVQHTGILIYLRPLGTSQHVLIGLQFQSICMKVQQSRAEASTGVLNREKEHFYRGKVMSIQTVILRN